MTEKSIQHEIRLDFGHETHHIPIPEEVDPSEYQVRLARLIQILGNAADREYVGKYKNAYRSLTGLDL